MTIPPCAMSRRRRPGPAETTGFVFNHTMLRVKDITASLDFYTRVLGYQLIDKRDFPEAQFSLYFLAYLPAGVVVPEDDSQRRLWMAGLPGVLELTHNHGTETQDGAVYHDGNSDPRGFGHICVSVPDIEVACQRFEDPGNLPEAADRRSHEEPGLHQGPGRLLGRDHRQRLTRKGHNSGSAGPWRLSRAARSPGTARRYRLRPLEEVRMETMELHRGA